MGAQENEPVRRRHFERIEIIPIAGRGVVAAVILVLVDSPPIFPVADASLLATMVDGVVLVVRGERTPRHLTREAIARLRFMQAKILGVVLNGVDPGARQYAYRYSYYFQEAAEA